MAKRKPIAKKRGRQPRLDNQVKVSGAGRFKTPRSFQWHPIPKGGVYVPAGSLVKVTKDSTIGGRKVRAGTLVDTRKD